MGLAEEIGLGPQIGDWMLRTSLSYCKQQSERGACLLPIALNLSNSQFQVSGLLDRITQAITTYGLEPSCLELEITESVVVYDRLAARQLLAKFKALGIATAIDDFGTGQSALSTLRGLPVDALKIDRSFIRDLDGCESDRAITASIIDIGHHLGMTVSRRGGRDTEAAEHPWGDGVRFSSGDSSSAEDFRLKNSNGFLRRLVCTPPQVIKPEDATFLTLGWSSLSDYPQRTTRLRRHRSESPGSAH